MVFAVGNSSDSALLVQATQLSQLQEDRASQQQVLISDATTCNGHAVPRIMETQIHRTLSLSEGRQVS